MFKIVTIASLLASISPVASAIMLTTPNGSTLTAYHDAGYTSTSLYNPNTEKLSTSAIYRTTDYSYIYRNKYNYLTGNSAATSVSHNLGTDINIYHNKYNASTGTLTYTSIYHDPSSGYGYTNHNQYDTQTGVSRTTTVNHYQDSYVSATHAKNSADSSSNTYTYHAPSTNTGYTNHAQYDNQTGDSAYTSVSHYGYGINASHSQYNATTGSQSNTYTYHSPESGSGNTYHNQYDSVTGINSSTSLAHNQGYGGSAYHYAYNTTTGTSRSTMVIHTPGATTVYHTGTTFNPSSVKNIPAVPEPGTLPMMLVGLGLLWVTRKQYGK